MNDYMIGAGAVLTAGSAASVAGAALHAQTHPSIAGTVKAALVDFEATDCKELSRVVIMAVGWNGRRFEAEVVRPLLEREVCSLGDVLEQLARAASASEVHIFARWLPDELVVAALSRAGIQLVSHPLEAISQAALISGQSYRRWRSPLRAA